MKKITILFAIIVSGETTRAQDTKWAMHFHSSAFFGEKQIILHVDPVNYKGILYVNNIPACTIDSNKAGCTLDISPFIRSGSNEIAVKSTCTKSSVAFFRHAFDSAIWLETVSNDFFFNQL